MLDPWVLADILAKTLLYFGVLTGAGLVMVRFAFASLVHDILPAIQKLAFKCAVLALIAALVSFALRGAALTGDASGITDPAILGMMWQTPVGSALAFRLAGVAAMAAGTLLGGAGWHLALLGAGGAIWSFSTIGHVPGGNAFWLQLVLFVHLGAVSFWIGILFPLGRLANRAQTVALAGQLGHRFGMIAAMTLPVLILAGVILSWKLLGSFDAVFGTSYGLVLLAKLAGVTSLLMLGALNKFRVVPTLATGDLSAGKSLARVLRAEWVVIALVLLATSILTTSVTIPVK